MTETTATTYKIDATEIDARGWSWSVGTTLGIPGRFHAAVHWVDPNAKTGQRCKLSSADTPQEALNAAYEQAVNAQACECGHLALYHGSIDNTCGECPCERFAEGSK